MSIYNYIDYTLLKPTATYYDIYDLCADAEEKGCASVCIPSYFVKFAHKFFPKLNICTVVGFPLGNVSTVAKIAEASKAITDGASEIDMVMNISEFKEKDYKLVRDEIDEIKSAIGDKTLKVIIETCYLTDEEIAIATQLVDKSMADYIKTSTGFGTGGATFEAVEIIQNNIKYGLKVKASGGIRTADEVITYIMKYDCKRIGMSKLP